MNKTSAVEWLEDALAENLKDIVLNLNSSLMDKLFEQAKEMEKKELFEFFQAGQDSMEEGGKSFDQYFEQTFNKDKK